MIQDGNAVRVVLGDGQMVPPQDMGVDVEVPTVLRQVRPLKVPGLVTHRAVEGGELHVAAEGFGLEPGDALVLVGA